MALIYNGKEKGWTYTPEKTDYFTDYNTQLPTGHWEQSDNWVEGAFETIPGTNGWSTYTYWAQNEDEALNEVKNNYNQQLKDQAIAFNNANTAKNNFYLQVYNPNGLGIVNATSYNYLDSKQAILNKKNILIDAGISQKDADDIVNGIIGPSGQYKNYYATERITPWDSTVLPGLLSSTVKERSDVQSDTFNTYKDGKTKGYYINETAEGKAAKARWDKAIADDNLDIIARYLTLEQYAYQDYIQQLTTRLPAEVANIRGSEAKPYSPYVEDYVEQVSGGGTDAQKQAVLDKVQKEVFNLVPSQTPGATGYEFRDIQQDLSNLISSDKTINKLWTDAKNEVLLSKATGGTPGPWTKLINSLGVNDSMITNQESFGTLLSRVATLNAADAGDKKIINDNNALFKTVLELKSNAAFQDLTSYVPEINDAFTASVNASEKEQIKRFGEMRQSVLQDTIEQLKIAKRQENNIAFFKSSSVGQELTTLTQELNPTSFLGDLSIGGISPFGSSQQNFNQKFDVGLGDIFGTKNGLIYNWEDWFNNQIEKKYAGDIDIPNDYVPPKLRTPSNGFVTDEQINSDTWKKLDKAYADLKLNPNNYFAKSVVANVPTDYVPVANRKTVNKTWTDYETQLKTAGYIDAETLNNWAAYDEEYRRTGVKPANAPADYIVPGPQRMNQDVQFAKDFFSTYLKPRFDASQSISEFQDYIDVVKDTQNPFQTQDRLNALKLAAQTSVSQWFTDLQKAGDSKFNADYYFDPATYLKENGIGDSANPLIRAEAFTSDAYTKYLSSVAGIQTQKTQQEQKDKVNADWEAAKKGESTTNADGTTINWLQQAYNYGVDVTQKDKFAQLHYQLVGSKVPKLDADGNVVRDADGNIQTKTYDPAPNVYAPEVSSLYISYVLTPYLIDKANKIGSVFGQFIKPTDYVDEILNAVNLPQNKEQWATILKNNGLDPNASLNELKNTLVNAITQDSTKDINTRIGELLAEGKLPTQTELGVEYLQKATASGTTTAPSGVYAIFKNAGYSGSENDFYSTFLPEASQEDISIINAAYTPGGQASSLLPTISGTGMEQIASMAQLFGDTSITEILGTAGISAPTGQPSLLGGLFSSSEEDVGIGDPFATTQGTTKPKAESGIENPFDEVGITDPFAEDSDPFTAYNPFANIGSTSSVSNPTIKLNVNASTQRFSSSKNNSLGSLFDSFGGF